MLKKSKHLELSKLKLLSFYPEKCFIFLFYFIKDLILIY
jgi:hypothetical protein